MHAVFTWLWVGWLVYFGVVEALAIARSYNGQKGDTLSEHVWLWFGTSKDTHANTWAYVRRFVLIAFIAWLSVHFIGGGQLV